MTATVAPPAVNPWNVEALTERALSTLRLDPADDDAPTVAAKVVEATEIADTKLDMATPYATALLIPATLNEAVVTLAVELYRRKDTPGGMTDSWSSDGSFLRFSADVTKGVRSELGMHKARRGVA